MEPRSFGNAPIDLNFLIVGYGYQWGSVLVDPSLPIRNVKATVDTGFAAYSRVVDFWGQSGNVQFIVPYAHLTATGDVFAQSRSVERTGWSDLTGRVSVNLYGAPALTLPEFHGYHQDFIVGVSLQVTAPTGQYDASRLVNIGTNRWSLKPEIGISKAVRQWTFELESGVTFFTANNEYLGVKTHRQDPLFSVQGHSIFNFNQKLWAALDATYYTGGRTSVNTSLDNDLQRNSRWGGTLGLSLTRHNSMKIYFSSALAAPVGTDFRVFGIAWQYRWGAGL